MVGKKRAGSFTPLSREKKKDAPRTPSSAALMAHDLATADFSYASRSVHPQNALLSYLVHSCHPSSYVFNVLGSRSLKAAGLGFGDKRIVSSTAGAVVVEFVDTCIPTILT